MTKVSRMLPQNGWEADESEPGNISFDIKKNKKRYISP